MQVFVLHMLISLSPFCHLIFVGFFLSLSTSLHNYIWEYLLVSDNRHLFVKRLETYCIKRSRNTMYYYYNLFPLSLPFLTPYLYTLFPILPLCQLPSLYPPLSLSLSTHLFVSPPPSNIPSPLPSPTFLSHLTGRRRWTRSSRTGWTSRIPRKAWRWWTSRTRRYRRTTGDICPRLYYNVIVILLLAKMLIFLDWLTVFFSISLPSW